LNVAQGDATAVQAVFCPVKFATPRFVEDARHELLSCATADLQARHWIVQVLGREQTYHDDAIDAVEEGGIGCSSSSVAGVVVVGIGRLESTERPRFWSWGERRAAAGAR